MLLGLFALLGFERVQRGAQTSEGAGCHSRSQQQAHEAIGTAAESQQIRQRGKHRGLRQRVGQGRVLWVLACHFQAMVRRLRTLKLRT